MALLSVAAGLLVVALVFYLGELVRGEELVFPAAAAGGLLGGLLAVMLRGWRLAVGVVVAQAAAFGLAVLTTDALTTDCEPGETDCSGQGITFLILWFSLALAAAAGVVMGYAVRRRGG